MLAWNADAARHLLGRALFGYGRADLARALSYGSASDFVQKELLAERPQPAPPGAWVTEVPTGDAVETDRLRYRELTYWWYAQLLGEGTSAREKMVLFWHNHFTSDREAVDRPQFMYQQNALFRRQAWGNFGQLAKDVTVDPAMLIYLDGRYSSNQNPNENYARELMELFMMGIGNYTETDVQQAALALTGWRINGLTSYLKTERFANQPKTVLGRTGNLTATDVVDVILEKDVTARFICQKLYRHYVSDRPNAQLVEQMAGLLRSGNYELKPVLQFLFTSDEFYKPEHRSVKIKSPTEVLIGSLKWLNVVPSEWEFVYDTSKLLQQQLFNPPTVQGWPGQRAWMSSATYPQRGAYADALINSRKFDGKNLNFGVAPVTFARTFASAEDAPRFVRDVLANTIQFPVSAQKEQRLLAMLLDGTTAANWSTNAPGADTRIQKFLKAVMRLPEYQLV